MKKPYRKDLTNKIFPSGVKALEFAELRKGGAYWLCQCYCGNKFIARGADLTNGHTTSCGCKQKKSIQKIGKLNKYKNIKDLTNQRFGKLVVLEPTEKRDSCRSVIWKCQCDCGRIVELSSHVLQQGQVSCGCLNSKGELKISQLLLNNNIEFETQKSFNTCVLESGRKAKFDFYVEKKYIIEYDGIQHFEPRIGWNTEENFNVTKENDKIKNNWCLENNIPIIRIPYTIFSELKLEDLQLNSSKYLIK